MSSIAVEYPQELSTPIDLNDVQMSLTSQDHQDSSLELQQMAEQCASTLQSFIQYNSVADPLVENAQFQNQAQCCNEDISLEQRASPNNDAIDHVTISVSEIQQREGEIVQGQSVEERLIDKIAEFEGKVEALQSLKTNLYAAIEQLENNDSNNTDQQNLSSKQTEENDDIQVSTLQLNLATLNEEQEQLSKEHDPQPSQTNLDLQENLKNIDQELVDRIEKKEQENQQVCLEQQQEQIKGDLETASLTDTLLEEPIQITDDDDDGVGLLQLSSIECTDNDNLLSEESIKVDQTSQDQQISNESKAQEGEVTETAAHQQQRAQPESDSKLKKILDDFFSQVETEGALKAQQKKRQFQAGKENAPTNLGQQDSLETPKNHKMSAEDEQTLQQSPVKRKNNPRESLAPTTLRDDNGSTQVQTPPSHQENTSPSSPLKQEIAPQIEENPTHQELRSQHQENEPETKVTDENSPKENSNGSDSDSSDDTKKRTSLQKEKDQLRAPFSELNNGGQKKRSSETLKEGEKEKPKKNRIVDINKTIFVDSYILNYSTFYPGKLLGSTLNVGNLSNAEQIVELSIDSNSFQFNRKQLNTKFGNPELPFQLEGADADGKLQDTIVNSEIKHEAWFIENPISKELTKRITLKLGPKAEQDFIIVVRSPNAKRTENLVSIINIGLLTYADEQFGVKESFEDFLKLNYNSSMKEFLRDRKKVAQQQRIEIMLAGKVDVPSLVCQKELVVSEFSERVIPLVVKKGQSCQKFRIPFKNNGPQELDVDFTFHKQSAVIQGPLQRQNSNGDEKQRLPLTQSPIEFVSVPSNVKVPANGTAILNIAAKLKNSYQLASIGKDQNGQQTPPPAKAEKYNHLLIAKIKDTQIMFSFIIEASVLEASNTPNM